MAESSAKVKPWRQDVAAAAIEAAAEAGWVTPAGPLEVEITFYLPRPRYHYRTGKHAGEIKDTAPDLVDKKPDLDKLIRATLDALTTAGVIHDDAQIARLTATKIYLERTGASIYVRRSVGMSNYRDDPLGVKLALERGVDKQALGQPLLTTAGSLTHDDLMSFWDDEPGLPNDGDTE